MGCLSLVGTGWLVEGVLAGGGVIVFGVLNLRSANLYVGATPTSQP